MQRGANEEAGLALVTLIRTRCRVLDAIDEAKVDTEAPLRASHRPHQNNLDLRLVCLRRDLQLLRDATHGVGLRSVGDRAPSFNGADQAPLQESRGPLSGPQGLPPPAPRFPLDRIAGPRPCRGVRRRWPDRSPSYAPTSPPPTSSIPTSPTSTSPASGRWATSSASVASPSAPTGTPLRS